MTAKHLISIKINIHSKLSASLLAALCVLIVFGAATSYTVRAQDIVMSNDVNNIVFTYQDGARKTGKSAAKSNRRAAAKNDRKLDGRAASVAKRDRQDNNADAVPAAASTVAGESQEPVLAGGILNGLATYFESLGVSAEDLKKYRGDEVRVRVTVNAEGDVAQARAISGPAPLREKAAELARRASFNRSRFMNSPINLTGDLIYVVGEGDDFRKYDKSPNKTPLIVDGGALNGREISSLVNGASVADNGEVKVQVTIDEEGKVTRARAVSGNPALYKAAADSASSWTFPRTSVLGNQVKVSGYIVINFKSSI